MIEYNRHLTDSCSYEKFKSNNKYNEKTYETETSKKCFVSYDFENIKQYYEQDIVLTKRIFLDFEPGIYDKFDGMEIKTIRPVKGLRVGTIGWEVIV